MKPGRFSRSQRVYCTYEACVIPSPALTLFLFVQSGGGSVPPMKVVTPGASRLKAAQGQAGSPDKGKHGKQRAEYMRIQAQQQVSLGASGAGPRPHAVPTPHLTSSRAVHSCWALAVSHQCSCAHHPAAVQGGPAGQDYPTGPSNHFLLPLSSTHAQDLVENIARSLIPPLAEGPSLRAREDHLPSCSWTRRSEQTPMPGPF